MDSNLSAFADRLKNKLDDATGRNLVISDQELLSLMDNHLDAVSAAAAHASGHCSGHLSNHGSSGRELEMESF